TSGVHKNTILRWAKIFGHNTDQIPPNATITSATLKVHGYSGSYGVPIYAYKVLEAWNQNQLNQVSWSSRSVDWAGNTAWSVGGCGGNPSRGSTALGSDTYNTVKGSIEMSMGKTGRETTKMAKAARHGRQCRGIMSLHEIGAESFDRQ
ncbi:MAG: hypothetical protein ACREJ2_15570, partial [Planctomycetota bacterium]